MQARPAREQGLIDEQAKYEDQATLDPGLASDEDIDAEVDAEGGAATQKRRA